MGVGQRSYFRAPIPYLPLSFSLRVDMSRRTSQASTMVGSDIWQSQEEKSHRTLLLKRAKEAATSQDVFLFLVAFRILNALSIKTFFQPDEFFQSLEPAWQIAFGDHSGVWITWVGFAISMEYGSHSFRNGRTSSVLLFILQSLRSSTGFPLACPICSSFRLISVRNFY